MSGAMAAVKGDTDPRGLSAFLICLLRIYYSLAPLSSQINLLCTYEILQMGVGERKNMWMTSSQGKDFTHYDFVLLMLSERKS